MLVRVYTDAAGDICFYYAYQAGGALEARHACELLSPSGQGVTSSTSLLPVVFGGVAFQTTVSASPWQVVSAAPLGVPIPEQWSAEELLLWGCGGGTALCVFAAGACCCIAGRVGARDRAIVGALLAQDRQMLRELRELRELRKPATSATAAAPTVAKPT